MDLAALVERAQQKATAFATAFPRTRLAAPRPKLLFGRFAFSRGQLWGQLWVAWDDGEGEIESGEGGGGRVVAGTTATERYESGEVGTVERRGRNSSATREEE
jgi:hypothetical protein